MQVAHIFHGTPWTQIAQVFDALLHPIPMEHGPGTGVNILSHDHLGPSLQQKNEFLKSVHKQKS